MKKNIINAVTGIIVGGLFLFLTLRNKPVGEILTLLSTARSEWIFLALILLVIMFLFRAYRWKILIENNGSSASIKNISYSMLLGFFINSFTPKLGEIIRCTSLQKSSGIPVSKSFGTVISERIYDLLALVTAISVILILEFNRLNMLFSGAVNSIGSSLKSNIPKLILFATAFIAAVIILIYIFRHYKLINKLKTFFREFWLTVKNTFRIKSYGVFILQTFIIWLLMVLMNYCCLRSLPSTQDLNLYFAFVVLFVGTIGLAIPSPGGIGTTHFFVLQLFLLFNMNEETGITYGILVNGITVLFTIFGGLLAIIIVHLFKLITKKEME